jgi:hypothetical protein
MYNLKEKPDQHVTRISHSVHVWSQTIRISHGQHIATFHEVVNSGGQSHCSWAKGLPTQSTARRLTDLWVHTQFISQDSHWSSGGKTNHYWRQATRLTGLISLTYDVQYLLTGVNSSVLNWHRRGLQPPKGLARSQVIQSQHSHKWNGETPIAGPWSFDHSASTKIYIYA